MTAGESLRSLDRSSLRICILNMMFMKIDRPASSCHGITPFGKLS
jgi:hypothetical protein